MNMARNYPVMFLASVVLFGCATDRIHKEGIELVNQGQIEAGLAKLQQAVKDEPDNLAFRADLLHRREQIVAQLLDAANSERAAGHPAESSAIYNRVLKIEADNSRAKLGLAAIARDERHAQALIKAQALFDKHDPEAAQSLLQGILLENPNYADAKQLQRKIDEQIAKDAMAGPSLKPEFKKPITLQFRDANLKMVIEAISRSNNLNILLDKDVKPDLKTTIFVKDAPLDDTLDLILMQNQLEKKILSDNTIFIYPNNPIKIKEYQDLKIRTFQLTNADAKQIQTMLKTLLKTRDLFIDEKNNTVVMRDTPDAIRLAEKLIAAQDLPEPEVMLEVEVLEITRDRLKQLGLRLPQQIDVNAPGIPAISDTHVVTGVGTETTVTPAQPLTLRNLGSLNGSMFNISQSSLSGGLDLRQETGNANILASPRIRVRNKEKAKIMIGDRVPVITNAVTPVASGSSVVTGSVQYLDVGLKLEVEPDIHLDDDVAIKVSLEVSNLVREVSSGNTLAYQIGTRSANTVLRLKDGETQVLAGLISDEDRKSAQQFPGLSDLPLLGRLFSSNKEDAKKSEIVLSITPHLTRASQRPDASTMEFWSGTDNTLRSAPVMITPTALHKKSKPTAMKPAADNAPSSSEDTPSATPVDSGVNAVAPSGPPILLNWNGPAQVSVGKEIQVTLEAQTTQPLGTLSFTLDYDPTVMTITKVAQGELLKQDGKKTIFTDKIDAKDGHIFTQVSRVGKDGTTGKGSIATFTFKALAAKTQVPLVLTSPSPLSGDGRVLPLSTLAPWVITVNPEK
ncbi:MAG: secretin and TonB N-terminal domain-containing protein [Gammaproteobacteria bacterium]|nr:secretin and TonB N-terminal domain-containing protein [Gammaproteobacteria bacterium]